MKDTITPNVDITNELEEILYRLFDDYFDGIEGNSGHNQRSANNLNNLLKTGVLGIDDKGNYAKPVTYSNDDFCLLEKDTQGRQINLLRQLKAQLEAESSETANSVLDVIGKFIDSEGNELENASDEPVMPAIGVVDLTYVEESRMADIQEEEFEADTEYLERIALHIGVMSSKGININPPQRAIDIINTRLNLGGHAGPIFVRSEIVNNYTPTPEPIEAVIEEDVPDVELAAEKLFEPVIQDVYTAQELLESGREFELKDGEGFDTEASYVIRDGKAIVFNPLILENPIVVPEVDVVEEIFEPVMQDVYTGEELLASGRDFEISATDGFDADASYVIRDGKAIIFNPLMLENPIVDDAPEVDVAEGASKVDAQEVFTAQELLESGRDFKISTTDGFDADAKYVIRDGEAIVFNPLVLENAVVSDDASVEPNINKPTLTIPAEDIASRNLGGETVQDFENVLPFAVDKSPSLGWRATKALGRGANNLVTNLATGAIAAGVLVTALAASDPDNLIVASVTDATHGSTELASVDPLGAGTVIAINGVPVGTIEPVESEPEVVVVEAEAIPAESETQILATSGLFSVVDLGALVNQITPTPPVEVSALDPVVVSSEPVIPDFSTEVSYQLPSSDFTSGLSAMSVWKESGALFMPQYIDVPTGFTQAQLDQHATSYVDPDAQVVRQPRVADAGDSISSMVEQLIAEDGGEFRSTFNRFITANPQYASHPSRVAKGAPIIIPDENVAEANCIWSRVVSDVGNACSVPQPETVTASIRPPTINEPG